MTNRSNIHRANQRQIILNTLTTISYRAHDLKGYLYEIACGVSQLLNSDWSIVTLYEESKGRIVASSSGLDDNETEFVLQDTVSEIVVYSGHPFWIEDVKHCPHEAKRMAGFACYLGVPLRVSQQEVVGTICSYSEKPQQYDAELIAAVELFAERAATAIDNYQLYQKQQKFNELLEAEVSKRTMELRTIQAKLIEQERLAAIGEFTAMIVHEMRNPLTTVRMGLDYFKKSNLSQPAKTRLSLAIDEADRLANLLQEILNYARPQRLRRVELNINDFMQDLLISLQSMPQAHGRFIEYCSLNSAVIVLADRDKLKQVLINLIRNAFEAIEPGDTVCCGITQKGTDEIEIFVQNGGAVIPASVLSQVIQPFYSTKPEGTGLGLAIVKRIIDAHNGKLMIESSEQDGTIFRVRLPLKCY